MDSVKATISKNISALRRQSGMTQLELAEKLNYSDKAVSKWESGASVPDVAVLVQLSRMFGVSLDYLVTGEDAPSGESSRVAGLRLQRKRHRIITWLSIMLIWLIATALFVILSLTDVRGHLWLSFIWALPASAVVAIVFNTMWGVPRRNYAFISLLMWSVLTGIYLTMLSSNLWLIFVMGVPGQVIIILWAGMNRPGKDKNLPDRDEKEGF